MPDNGDLVRHVKSVMIKVWRRNDADLEKYASRLLARVEAGDTRYALDLQARDIQVNWLKLPLTNDYSEVVDWTLALVRNVEAL